jgi:hypothetical protein
MRIRRSLLAIAVAAGIATPAAAAAAGGGPLTGAEYQQLREAQTRLNHVNRTPTLKDAEAALLACEEIQMETPLLTQERAWCDAGEEIVIFDINARRSAESCLRHTTTQARLGCLASWYARFDAAVHANYRASENILSIARARGFSPSCTSFLAGSPAEIAYTADVYAAIKLAIKALRSGNAAAFRADNKLAGTYSTRLAMAENSHRAHLSACTSVST